MVRPRGFVLFVMLVFLLIFSLLGISMFGGFIQDQKASGNYREKTRAVEAAQTALDQSQYWLGQPGNVYTGTWNTGTACTTVATTQVVCSNALANPTTLPWTVYASFTPSGMTVNAGGGVNTYASNTNYYIQYVGTTGSNPPTALYQVTSTAAGGNAQTNTVLQAVYQVQATSRDISGS